MLVKSNIVTFALLSLLLLTDAAAAGRLRKTSRNRGPAPAPTPRDIDGEQETNAIARSDSTSATEQGQQQQGQQQQGQQQQGQQEQAAEQELPSKEVHKRGIFYSGGALGTNWPTRTYAAHYGYSLQLPAGTAFLAATGHHGQHHHLQQHAHLAPQAAVIKYAAPSLAGAGFHYKTYAPGAVSAFAHGLSGVPHLHAANGAALPVATGGLSGFAVGVSPAYATAAAAATPVVPAVPAVATATAAVAPAPAPVPAASPSFVIRPGNAYVSSYSVNYPQQHFHKQAAAVPVAVRPAAVQPVHFHTPAVQTTTFVQSLQPAIPAAPAVPVAPAAPAVPVAPAVPAAPEFPAIPAFPAAPAFPNIPAFPLQPAQPALPEFPAIPQIPETPQVPQIPQTPQVPQLPQFPQFPQIPQFPQFPPFQTNTPPTANFPQPGPPGNQFFPVAVQPPLPQQPASFVPVNIPLQPIQPEAQFPPALPPTAGPSNPDTGNAIASPQIPQTPIQQPQQPQQPQLPPSPAAEPELPIASQPTPQQPWKPVLYQPPTSNTPQTTNANRPSITLLPPYGAPSEGYLPPDPAQSQSQQLQQQQSIFDNLTDAEIEQIFAQANLAQQQQQRHYASHY